jgi:HEAT repeat protein
MLFYRPPSLQNFLETLGSVCRALRAWQFYPKGHPSRRNSIQLAHAAMVRMLDNNDLSLACGRSGFSFPDGEAIKDSVGIASSLSYELFVRRGQKITFLKDLHQEDLLDLLRIISLPPDDVLQAGGMAKIMEEHGIRTIWINEFDLSIIQGKRREVESRGVVPQGIDDAEEAGIEASGNPEDPSSESDLNPEDELNALVERLKTDKDEDIYPILARRSITCSEALISRGELKPLLPLTELFATHSAEAERGEKIIGIARFGLEQLATKEEFLEFVLDSLGDDNCISRKGALAVLAAGGPAAVRYAVEKMGATDNLGLRKKLARLLAHLGESAVAPILPMLNDSRWYIVRNLAAILGDIGSSEAVPELAKCLRHPDIRVAKEAVRSLAKIGDTQAEAAVISALRDASAALRPQAISSLGGMKSRRAVPLLLQIVGSDDLFLKNLALKINALAAVAMIGDQQATPRLIELLESRHLVSRSRWLQLKMAIAACLGKLGDERSLHALKNMARGSGDLAWACAEAVEAIERTGR